MSALSTAKVGQTTLFKAGWSILLTAAALMALNHFALLFTLNEPTLFLGWGIFNLYSLVVIAIPFRRLEKWAWYATWILPAGLIAAGFYAGLMLFYGPVGLACVLGLLIAMRDFFAVER